MKYISSRPEFHACMSYNNNPSGVTRGHDIYILLSSCGSSGVPGAAAVVLAAIYLDDDRMLRPTFHNAVVYNTWCTIKLSIIIIIITIIPIVTYRVRRDTRDHTRLVRIGVFLPAGA